ncbi:hypothetical protein O181_057399 [Austropuccinia psidii MF-1]|uniref:Uncharacterized protein n=1 Tax=Austropuccinia psidii MF-1 TaxID=1389203 RepID=A0A9Q3EAH5_9BASI|nr:hypothetical protein [Austropuccinia psidii MF-1]
MRFTSKTNFISLWVLFLVIVASQSAQAHPPLQRRLLVLAKNRDKLQEKRNSPQQRRATLEENTHQDIVEDPNCLHLNLSSACLQRY